MADPDKEGPQRAPNGARAVGDAALNLGVSVARSIAEGLSGRPQPPLAGESKVAGIVRYGTHALGSLVAMTVTAAREAGIAPGRNASAAPSASAAAPAAPGIPHVAAGTSLRVPLSIDNPGTQPMTDLTPRLIGARHDGAESAAPFTLQFAPASLSIAPHDFEKLVATIDLPADMPEGHWSALFALGANAPDPNEIAFFVSTPGK